jgi:hypothetical protein
MQVATAPIEENSISEAMIGTGPLVEILETVLHSSHITHSIPLSVMLIGPSGAGKSKLVMQYQHSAGCHLTSDITSMGLQEILAKDIDGKIHFIILPDFNLVLSHRQSTLQLTIGNLLSMTSEGTIRIDDGRAVKETKHSPIGIISAMTREMYATIGKKWLALGFNRRFIPINYDYSLKTREKVQLSIANGLTTMLHLAEKKISIPKQKINVQINEECSARIRGYSGELATNIGWIPSRGRQRGRPAPKKDEPARVVEHSSKHEEFKPKAIFTGKQIEFSPHIVLRTIARSHALREGRDLVNESDLEFVMQMIEFTRYDKPVML